MIAINDINTDIPEGKYLLMAIAKITVESQKDKTPDEVLNQIKEVVNHVYTYNLKQEEVDKIQKIVSESFLKQSIDKLVREFKKDKSEGSFYHSWQSNIATAFIDEFNSQAKGNVLEAINKIDEIANDAAKRFLDQLIGE